MAAVIPDTDFMTRSGRLAAAPDGSDAAKLATATFGLLGELRAERQALADANERNIALRARVRDAINIED